MLTEQQRERMCVELRRAGFRDEVEIRRIVDRAGRYVGEGRRTPRQWRKLYEEANSRAERAALVITKHLEDWRGGELSEQEVTLLELDGARAIGRPW